MARIIFADDEPALRDIVAFTLRFAGHEVFVAGNGEEVVVMTPKVNPDLILMDVRMPRMTGYEACRVVKSNSAFKDIPVVFLSAKCQESEIQCGLEAGADDYLLKPFAPDQLTQRVKMILAMYGK